MNKIIITRVRPRVTSKSGFGDIKKADLVTSKSPFGDIWVTYKKAERNTSQSSQPSTSDFDTLACLSPLTSSNMAW